MNHISKFAVTWHGEYWPIMELSITGNCRPYRHNVNRALEAFIECLLTAMNMQVGANIHSLNLRESQRLTITTRAECTIHNAFVWIFYPYSLFTNTVPLNH